MANQNNNHSSKFICLNITDKVNNIKHLKKLESLKKTHNIVSIIVDKSFSSEIKAKSSYLSKISKHATSHSIALILNDGSEYSNDYDGIIIRVGDKDEVEKLKSVKAKINNNITLGALIPPSRHLAMHAGEVGIDFIVINLSDHKTNNSSNLTDNNSNQTFDFIKWWQDKAVIPLIAGNIKDIEMAKKAWQAGADYLLLEETLWLDDKKLHKISKFNQ